MPPCRSQGREIVQLLHFTEKRAGMNMCVNTKNQKSISLHLAILAN